MRVFTLIVIFIVPSSKTIRNMLLCDFFRKIFARDPTCVSSVNLVNDFTKTFVKPFLFNKYKFCIQNLNSEAEIAAINGAKSFILSI